LCIYHYQPHVFYADDVIGGLFFCVCMRVGPNIFWLLSALQYVKHSSNYTWLRTNIVPIESAMSFLTNMIDHQYLLMRVPGNHA
jgi:hypothetical protein